MNYVGYGTPYWGRSRGPSPMAISKIGTSFRGFGIEPISPEIAAETDRAIGEAHLAVTQYTGKYGNYVVQLGDLAQQVHNLASVSGAQSAIDQTKQIFGAVCAGMGAVSPAAGALCGAISGVILIILNAIPESAWAHPVYAEETIAKVVAKRLGFAKEGRSNMADFRAMAEAGWGYTWTEVYGVPETGMYAEPMPWLPATRFSTKALLDMQFILSDVPGTVSKAYKDRVAYIERKLYEAGSEDVSEALREFDLLAPNSKSRTQMFGGVKTTSFGTSGIAFVTWNVKDLPLDMIRSVLVAQACKPEEFDKMPSFARRLIPHLSKGTYGGPIAPCNEILLERMARRLNAAQPLVSRPTEAGVKLTTSTGGGGGKVVAAVAGVGITGAILWAILS